MSLFNRIYKLLKTNKMSEIKESVRSYQWKKGDDFGKIVVVDDVSDGFTNFSDGSKIFTSVLPEFLTEIINGEVPYPGAGGNITNVQADSPKASVIVESTESTDVYKSEISPLQTLVRTLSKKNVEGVDVKLNINIPKKKVIEMLIENSEEEKSELVSAVVDNAIKEIEINKLQEFLQTEITNFINKYYE
tara:strand:- start:1810 stop:2379 length:570 start_codon:yes stop_codon:yes gene_type:complete